MFPSGMKYLNSVIIMVYHKMFTFSGRNESKNRLYRPAIGFTVKGVENIHSSTHEAGTVKGQMLWCFLLREAEATEIRDGVVLFVLMSLQVAKPSEPLRAKPSILP